MLKIDGAGWAIFSINGKTLTVVSYVSHGPYELLEMFIEYFEHSDEGRSVSVALCDESDFDSLFTISNMFCGDEQVFFTYATPPEGQGSEKLKPVWKVMSFDVSPRDLAKELIADIEGDLENWAKWHILDDSDENGLKKIKQDLTNLIAKLKDLIKPHEIEE